MMDVEVKYKLKLIRWGLWICAILYSGSVLLGSWVYTGWIQIGKPKLFMVIMLGTAGVSLLAGIVLAIIGYKVLRKG